MFKLFDVKMYHNKFDTNVINFSVFYSAALEKLREEFKADSESLVHSEAISILSLCDE